MTNRKTIEVARKRVPLKKLLHGKEIREAAKALEDFRLNLNEAEFLYGAKITLTMDSYGECTALAKRPETDKEYADRLEKARLAAEAKRRREAERKIAEAARREKDRIDQLHKTKEQLIRMALEAGIPRDRLVDFLNN
jgi:hypothetical protein